MNKPLQYAEKFVANNCKKAIDVNGLLYIPLNEVIRLISERTNTIHYKHKWEFARFVCDNEYRNKLILMNNTLKEKREYKNIPLLYIAGKLNDEAVGYLNNVASLMKLAEKARKAGFAYFCPAIDLLMGVKFEYDDYHQYFDNGQVVLLHCDGVLVNHNWETSTGTKAEIALAEENGIPVYYSVEEAYDALLWSNKD